MRSIPAPLQTHIDGEVLSLTRCIKITRTDGVVLRLTTHDRALTVSGDLYRADIPFDVSALESTDNLAVDNAELTIGIDEIDIKTVDLESGLYDNALFEMFLVNWDSPGDGIISLKRGTLGDSEIDEGVSARIQLRGLTHILQRPLVERYSLTCRAALGSKRCGYVNMPLRIRRDLQKVRTFDWFLEPSANVTTPSLTNLSFESAPTTGWTVPSGSVWAQASAFTPADGANYVEAGAGSSGQEHVIYMDLDTVTIGMPDANVDTGDYSFDFSTKIAATSSTFLNVGKAFIEQYDVTGVTLKREETPWTTPPHQSWEGIGVTSFILPGCRTVRIGLVVKINEGTAGFVAFDDCATRFWTNVIGTWGGAAFRTVKIPTYASDELLPLINGSFESDGAVGNTNAQDFTGWTVDSPTSYWQSLTSDGALNPINGTVFLEGGDDASGTPNKVYNIYQTIVLPTEATAANISAGWYYAELLAAVTVTDGTAEPRIVLQFLDAGNTVLDTQDSGYISGLSTHTWYARSVGGRVPATATKVKVTLYAKSGNSGSLAKVAFDDVGVYFFPTAYEHPEDLEEGYLASSLPTLSYTSLDYTIDGDAIVQAKGLNFGYAAVTSLVSNRAFEATAINQTPEEMYSGKIIWLSGNNAGRSSFVRVWDNTSKEIKTYDILRGDIQIGDKFVYALGCDKTIDTCADRFGNAHNFQGEPYLPGPSRVITFLTSTGTE